MSILDFIQIHLMFLFITNICTTTLYSYIFKYISCSYLSLFAFSSQSLNPSFKYISCSYLSINDVFNPPSIVIFKYISCSYLSVDYPDKCVARLLFKYISCSYLSCGWPRWFLRKNIQIHLMFLFIEAQGMGKSILT